MALSGLVPRRYWISLFCVTSIAVLGFVLHWDYFVLAIAPEERLYTSLRNQLATQNSGCIGIEGNSIKRMKDAKRLSVHVFNAQTGSEIRRDDVLAAGSTVCIVVAVPQHGADKYEEAPIRGKAPDDVHLLVHGTSSLITSLPLEALSDANPELDAYYSACPQESISLYECWKNFYNLQADIGTTLLYFAKVVLIHPDTYMVQAEVENVHYNWAKQWTEDPTRHQTLYTSGLKETWNSWNERLGEYGRWHKINPSKVADQDKWPPLLNVGAPVVAQTMSVFDDRPFCDSGLMAANGRWYTKASNLTDAPDEVYDQWNFAWDGDDCRLDWYNYIDMLDCLANKNIHVYGDSNLRRLIKSIVSGNTFCQGDNAEDVCQHDDKGIPYQLLHMDEQGQVTTESVDDNTVADDTAFGVMRPFHFGRNSTIFHDFTRTMAYNFIDWRNTLYPLESLVQVNSTDLYKPERHFVDTHAFDPSQDLSEGIQARPPSALPKADLVIAGTPAWDTQGATRSEDFKVAVASFAKALLEAYSDTPIVLRLLQGFCCRKSTNLHSRASGPRAHWYNEIILNAFKPAIEDGRVLVLDSRLLTGRPEELLSRYPANHLRYPAIRVETQMLMNSICERTSGPGTGFRPSLDWRLRAVM